MTYFLLGEDKMERLRRISVGKNDTATPESKRSLCKFKQLSNGTDSTLSLKSLWAPCNSMESGDITISQENVVIMNGSVRYASDGSVEFDV